MAASLTHLPPKLPFKIRRLTAKDDLSRQTVFLSGSHLMPLSRTGE